jgi:hypothetical protein
MLGFASTKAEGEGRGTFLAAVLAVAVVAFFSWLTIMPGYPKLYAPLNLLMTIPAMHAAEVARGSWGGFFAIPIVPVFFCAWSWGVLRGRVKLPVRSLVLLVLAVLLSAAHIGFGYKYGVKYQSPEYTAAVAIISLIFWVVLGALAILASRRPTFRHNLVFHTVLFSWLAWYAFPYLGELP